MRDRNEVYRNRKGYLRTRQGVQEDIKSDVAAAAKFIVCVGLILMVVIGIMHIH